MRIVQERVVREIRPLRARRVLETGSRKLLNGHENGYGGYDQRVSDGSPRQRPTLPGPSSRVTKPVPLSYAVRSRLLSISPRFQVTQGTGGVPLLPLGGSRVWR